MNNFSKQSGQPEVYIKAVQFLESKGLSFQDFGLFGIGDEASIYFQMTWDNSGRLVVALFDDEGMNNTVSHEFTLNELPAFCKMAEMVIQASQWETE